MILSLVVLGACSSDAVPVNIIAPDTMKKLLWQMSVAEQVIASDTGRAVHLHMKDSVTYAYAKILKDNKISFGQYKKSM
ncbi:MAG TPA: DUF4296 domain-containing protein, partial [Arachidicoccus sp.]